jgi:acyl transferase domain-containing protein/nucleoside-diphosphate-sugar epimerase/NADPH:quinone reductase-like Zn-dependent oxidoreductase/arylamine N-acetyltransferase/ectoine hydroxylase-related dioxygenase (phytanoyl-CoA dioxygenase family)
MNLNCGSARPSFQPPGNGCVKSSFIPAGCVPKAQPTVPVGSAALFGQVNDGSNIRRQDAAASDVPRGPHLPPKVFVNGYATCGPGFQTASELCHGLLSQRDFASEEMDRKNQFDSKFFYMSKEQSSCTDPQIRLLLELTYEALVETGVGDFSNLPLRDTGVYVGSSFSDFQQVVLADDNHMKGGDHIGAAGSMLANRISQYFHFGGPSMKIDSACSSSLQALDIACRDIRSGKVTMAIVAGSNLIIDPMVTTVFQEMRMVSTTSRPACKTFTDMADGYVRKEAIAVMVLSNEDVVGVSGLSSVAEILGHCTLSGSGDGITTPSVETQELLYRKVATMASSFLGNGDVPLVRYVECHGTGTKVGDEAETLALTNIVQASDTDDLVLYKTATNAPLLIGSVKSNIGHTEAASGLMGVIKALLSLESGNVLPNLHYSHKHRNPRCSGLDDGTLTVVNKLEPIEKDAVAVINSFGFGGTYVQVMVKGISPLQKEPPNARCKERSGGYVDENEPWKNINAVLGRSMESTRKASLLALTSNFCCPVGPPSVHLNELHARAFTTPVQKQIHACDDNASTVIRPVWVVFSGNGADWPGMGFELYKRSHIYKDTYDHCSAYLCKKWGCDSLQRLLEWQQTHEASCIHESVENENPFGNVIDATVCLTSLQVCLINVLKAAQLTRATCAGYIGYSAGEMAAGYFDESLSLETTLDIAFLRGEAAADVADRHPGAMLAVTGLSRKEMECMLSEVFSNSLVVACHTGPKQVTLSGLKSEVDAFELELKVRYPSCPFRRVNTYGVAFHSDLIDDSVMETLQKKLDTVFEACRLTKRTDKWISSCYDDLDTNGDFVGSAYYCDGFKKCVEFERKCIHIPEGAIVVECGPSGLLRSVFAADRAGHKRTQYMSLLKRNTNAVETFATVYGNLFLARVLLTGPIVPPKTAFPDPMQRALREAFISWDHSVCFSKYLQPHVESRLLTVDHEVNKDIVKKQSQNVPIGFHLDGDDMWLRQHRVDGRCLLPASVFLYAIWKHMHLERNEQCVVKNFKIHCPVDISTLAMLWLHVEVIDSDVIHREVVSNGSRELHVMCNTDHGSATSKELIASCSVLIESKVDFEPSPSESPLKANESVDVQALYHRLGRHEYDYGKDFRMLTAMSTDRNRASLQVGAHSARKAAILVLEGMIQCSVAFELNSSQYGPCRVPVIIDRVTLCHLPSPQTADVVSVYVHSGDQRGVSIIVNNFATITGVQLQKRSSAFSFVDETSVGKLELVSITPTEDAGDDNDDDANALMIKSIFLECDEEMSSFDVWNSVLREQRESYKGSGIVLLISEAPGFCGFVRSLRKEPDYAHIRGLQLLVHADDTKSDRFDSLVKKAHGVFANRSDLSCLFAGRGIGDDSSMFSLLEENDTLLDGMVFPSPHGCFLALSTAEQPSEKSYCWQPISRTKTSNLLTCNIEIEYASLNFRDAMIKSGALHRDQAISGYGCSGGGFGLDFAGYRLSSDQLSSESDCELQSKRTKVIGLGRDCIASDMYSQPINLLWELPDSADLETLATVPCAYATAYYALCVRGQLGKNDKVLVHCGAGGVGQAALYICNNRLCDPSSQLFVTCGDERKRKFIHEHFGIPMGNIGDSRSSSFQDVVMEQTQGDGVRMVLNSLVGVLMEASVDCLSFGGMLLELGKADIEPHVMRKLRRNDRQLVMVDLDQIMAHSTEFEPLHELITEGLHSGEVRPIFCTVYSMPGELDDAFESMSSGERIGKVLMKMERKAMHATVPSIEVALSEQSTTKKQVIIIIGGLGGLGLCLAQWLALYFGRVCSLVLCTFSGANSVERRQAVEHFDALQTSVDIREGDFGNRDVVEALMLSFLYPDDGTEPTQVFGFFNAAAKTQDMLFDRMDAEVWVRPFASKRSVTDNFSKAFCDPQFADVTACLRHFVCFSSIVVGVGNQGQTNYACANAAMEDIVARRVERHLPGLCIRLGIVPHTGLATSMRDGVDYAHLCPISVSNAMEQIKRLTLSEQSGIYTVHGTSSNKCHGAYEADVSNNHNNGILHADKARGYVLDIFRKHVQDGIIHEQTAIRKHSFDSLGMHILYDDLQKCLGCQYLSIDELFSLTPMEVADRYVSSTTVHNGKKTKGADDCECSVVVIATIGGGADNLSPNELISSSLRSIRDQTHQPDVVLVIFEQQTAEAGIGMTMEEVTSILPSAKVIYNKRTKDSMAGALNTGIMEAFSGSEVDDDFWVAFIDTSKNRWQSTHLEQCVKTVGSVGTRCGWVVAASGTAATAEDIETSDVHFFLQSDPKSSWLVRCTVLMEAGMFDEALSYSMDFDISIRLCDVMANVQHRAVTGVCTIDPQQKPLVAATLFPTSADVECLMPVDFHLFLYKHHPRMTREQLSYVMDGFGYVGNSETYEQQSVEHQEHGRENQSVPLLMWNSYDDREILIRRDTSKLLSTDDDANDCVASQRKMLVGITTSDTRRISGLLGDLGCMLDDKKHCVVIFANKSEIGFADKVSTLLRAYPFRGHVIRTTDRIVEELFSSTSIPLPIAKSRTVLQTFLYTTTQKEMFDAVAVLDDDSRLPKGWGVRDGDEEAGDILLGRAIKTPPNPTAMSMRTQLLDFLYALDIQHSTARGDDSGGSMSEMNVCPSLTCPSMNVFHDVHDQYYDLSSSRWDHLELPRLLTDYGDNGGANKDNFVEQCRRRILVGDPLAREAVSTEDGESCQRGGCMVVFRSQFHLLQYEQVAPAVTLATGERASSRRSDTFWVMNHHKEHGKKAVVRRHLSFLHDNAHDSIPTPEKIRESVALEMVGAILCRPLEKRQFAFQRIFALRCSIARIRGICKIIRGRCFFSEVRGLASFVDYLEGLFDEETWRKDVFNMIDKNLRTHESWQVSDEPTRDVLKSYSLNVNECAFLTSTYPDASDLCKGPVMPIPCLHRVHTNEEALTGAQKVQNLIGMSLSLSEAENRLRELSRLAHIVGSYRDHQIGTSRAHKALVTIDDGFYDVMLLQPIFDELSDSLQPVLCIPSGILRDGDEGMAGRHLPLTCLYEYCDLHGIEPNDESKLGVATRSVLKTLPEKEQYKRLEQAGIPTDLPTHDLLSTQDLKALSKKGWWVCSHGPDHSDLSKATSFDSVLRELGQDFDLIRHEEWAPWFAWPEGCWCTRTADAVAMQHGGATVQFGLSSSPAGDPPHPAVLNRAAWLGEGHRQRVLVTGSSGFLGQHLMLVLQGYGYDVFTYDITDGKDILDKEALLTELRRNRITSCVHLAAIADLNEAEKHPSKAQSVNVEGTHIVLSCCNEVNVRLLFASTCCVYGNNGVDGTCNELSPVKPTELYAKTKLVSEKAVLESSRTAELFHVVMRLATFYGPNMRAALATSLFLNAAEKKEPILIHGDGNQTRCFTHVHDIAEGIRVLLQTASFSGVVNVSDDRECSVNELANIAMRVSGNEVDVCHVKDRTGQIQRSKINNTLLRGLGNLGWKPTVTLEAGMLGCTGRNLPLNSKSGKGPSPIHHDNMHEQSRSIVAHCKLEHTRMPLRRMKCNGVMYVTESLPDDTQLIAYVVGDVQHSSEVHVRIHSECLTGDILGSLKCDCGPQKQTFLDYIGDDRPGVFLYVKGHEGRGTGLVTKTRAYHDMDLNPRKHHNAALLDAGAEKIDARCFDASAELILRVINECDSGDSNVNEIIAPSEGQKVKLLLHTNNKDKVDAVNRAIVCSETPLRHRFACQQQVIPAGENCNPLNQKYLCEKEVDNGQCGLSVCASNHPYSAIIPDNIDELPGVVTNINEAKFDANDSTMFDFLKENGYVVVHGLVPKEQVERAKLSFEIVQRNLFDGISQRVGSSCTLTSEDDYTTSISQVRDLFLREEEECSVFRELTENDTPTHLASMAQNAMKALDPEGQWTGIKLLHDHIITKPAGLRVSKPIPLHQDRMFWPVDIPACSTWTPLVDVPLNGGCLELLTLASNPHLHRQSVHAVDFMADEMKSGLKLVLEDDPHPVRWLVPMNAGDTLIFSSHAWHRSSPNNQPDSNRMAFIQTWVHPCARWRPDLVPWHPVNEHLRMEGCRPNDILAGERHPTVGMCVDTATLLSDDYELQPPPSFYFQTESVNVATKKLGAQISMFDASDVISTQIRNIFSLRISSFDFDHQPRKLLPLVDLIRDNSHRNQLVECTFQLLKCRRLPAEATAKLSHLYEESGCSTLRELIEWTLKEIMISAAAYECDRSRNVFNSAYSAWWTVAGEAWNEDFLTGKFTSNYELCKTDVSRFLERIKVNPSVDVDKLDLLTSIICGCMTYIPFQNFSMLTRVHPSSGDRCPPTLGNIIDDMLTGLGGLCSVRNPFLYLLLRALDFEYVRFVAGTMCIDNGDDLVDAHVALLVNVDHKEYWVDIANGWPYMKPFALDDIGDSMIIKHPFLHTRLVETSKKGNPVICVQHRQNPFSEWKDNYYFERSKKVDYDSVFVASMQKHYDSRENYGPFLSHFRFNMWSDEEGVLLRDNDTWVLSSQKSPLLHREECWDASKFAHLLHSSSFTAVDSLMLLIPKAWDICQTNAETLFEAEKITVTGGFFDESANGYIGMVTVWRSRTSDAVMKLTFQMIREYTPDIFPVINKGFAGGSWHNDELYVCWPNRVSVLTPSLGWDVRMHIDSPGFNDLHHVHACDHGMWVANTGCDTVDEVGDDGEVTARYPLSPDALSLIVEGEDLRDQKSHTARRGCHNEHINYVSPVQCDKSVRSAHDVTATLLRSKRVVSVGNLPADAAAVHTPMKVQLCPRRPPHEGFVATVPCVSENPLLWNSTVNGHVVASDPHTGETVRSWKICDFSHLPRGWTRGLVLLKDGFLVGCTSIYGDAASWIAQHDNNWDFNIDDSETAVTFIPFNVASTTDDPKSVCFLTNRKGKIFSLLHTPATVL